MIHLIFKLSSFFIHHVLHVGFLLKTTFFTFAVILFLSKAFSLLLNSKKIIYPLLSIRTDLSARYGKNSWAVITGASDGIGKTFAFELAKAGFNIVLVGRSQEKLQGVEKELKSKYQSTQTKIIVEDSENASDDQFSKRIVDQVKGLDVSFLVNNAGILIRENYTKIPVTDIKKIVTVNALAPALITRAFLPLLSQRKRSAMISVGSIAGEHPNRGFHIYGATKAFLDYISRGLKDEHKNIDFLSLKPSYVSTKMSGMQAGLVVVTPEECTRSALRALGHTESTYGHWKHSVLAAVARLIVPFFGK